MAAQSVPKMNLVSLDMAAAMIRKFTPTYELVKELGKGTYGQVFLAKDALKQIAVKIVPLEYRDLGESTAASRDVGQDWLRLQNSFNQLHHPSLVRIRDFFRYEDADPQDVVVAYGLIYMDYWPSNLRRCIRRLRELKRHTTSRKFALLIGLVELLDGLKTDTGLLVTDMKLSNVLVRSADDDFSGALSLALADFGGLHREGCSAVQRVESTDAYWAPELHDELQAEVDEKALIYSVGLMGFFILEGREPYQNEGLDAPMSMKIRRQGGLTWRGSTEGSEAGLRQIVARCLAESRAERYANFAALASDLVAARREWMQSTLAAILPSDTVWTEPVTRMAFVRLPGGEFAMGQSESETGHLKKIYSEERYARWFARELPAHKVKLSAFWMARFPVTRAQFACFVDDTLYMTDAEREGWSFGMIDGRWGEQQGLNWRSPGFEQDGSHPVVCVSWFDATEFAKWLSLRTGLEIGLPSEAQWEYACRAGDTAPFHTGETISPDQANYDGRASYAQGKVGPYRARTTPVGSFQSNSFGLSDLHGNVWEWCADRLDPTFYAQPEAQVGDPVCAHETGVRVRRGGSWSYAPAFLRSAYRGKNYPDARYSDIGFRLVIRARSD